MKRIHGLALLETAYEIHELICKLNNESFDFRVESINNDNSGWTLFYSFSPDVPKGTADDLLGRLKANAEANSGSISGPNSRSV